MAQLDNAPIIIDVKTQSKKRIKRLKNGTGKLLETVHAAIAEARSGRADNTEVVPVVIIVEKRASKKGSRRGGRARGGFLFPTF